MFYRLMIIGLLGIFLVACAAPKKSTPSKRGLMLIDRNEQPRNAKFASKEYQAKLQKNRKKQHRSNQQSTRRSSR